MLRRVRSTTNVGVDNFFKRIRKFFDFKCRYLLMRCVVRKLLWQIAKCLIGKVLVLLVSGVAVECVGRTVRLAVVTCCLLTWMSRCFQGEKESENKPGSTEALFLTTECT